MAEILAFAFGEQSLKKLQHKTASWKYAMAAALVFALTLTLPTEGLNGAETVKTFALTLVGYGGIITACFAMAKLLGSSKKAKEFTGVVSVAGAGAAVIVLIVAGLANLVNLVLKNDAFSSLALSLIPFYSFVLFGWACETASDLKSGRGILMGLFAVTLFVLLHIVLGS